MNAKKRNHNFESYIEKYPITLCVQTLRTPCRSVEEFILLFYQLVNFLCFNVLARNAGNYRRDGVVVRASSSQSIDLRFISQVESYQKTLENGIHSFPAWRSAK